MDTGATRGIIRDFVEGRGPVRAIAVAADASGPVDFPAALLDLVDVVTDATSGLDEVHPDHYGPVVAAFQTLPETGSTVLRINDRDGATIDLCLVDASLEFGCCLAVVVPAAGDSPCPADSLPLRPRRFGWTAAANGRLESIDDNVTLRLGWERDELVGDSARWLMHPDDQERSVAEWIEMLHSPQATLRARRRVATSDGQWVWGEFTYVNRLHDPEHRDVVVDVLDISDEMAVQDSLREREELLAKLTEALPAGVLHLDGRGDTQFANSRWRELTGVSTDELAEFCDAVIEPAELRELIEESLRSDLDRDVEVRLDAGPGHPVEYGSLRIRPLESRAGEERGLLLVLDDVTTQRRRRDNLTRAALRDPLTGVLNRGGLESELNVLVDRDEPMTLLFCDLDELKVVNDLYGHAAGDQAIRELAKSLTDAVRCGDLVGRIGGDEFVVVLPSAHELLVERVVSEVTQRLRVASPAANGEPLLSCSIGVAHRQPGEGFASLLERADSEMYQIKKLRRSQRV